MSDLKPRRALLLAAWTLFVFTHLGPFGAATARHLEWTNDRQLLLIQLAEDLTLPEKDPVFDGVFMVPTRPIIHPNAFLHSLTIRSLLEEKRPHVRDMLSKRPAAVIIPNYRTDWLAREDHAYIREHYISLSDDFWVLGKVLPPGGGEFEIIHPGRYRISSLEKSHLAGTYSYDLQGMMAALSPSPPEAPRFAAELDGAVMSDNSVELAVGTHRIETAADCQPAVVWIGPTLTQLPLLGEGDHRRLFYNWY